MYKFIKKNQKKMLAVFGVALMIVFILPTTMQQRQPQDQTAFTVGKEKVTMGEVRTAHGQWQAISSTLPLGAVGLVAADIEKHPELFVLLQREARNLGISVPASQVDETFTAIAQQFAMFRRPMPNPAEMKPALHSLMLVSALFERVADGIKPSGPLVLREMAQNGQRVKLDLVHYSADDFKKDVPAPTPEQLQKQFDEFKNIAPGSPGEQNPFGFGYLIPSQVQLLYLTVPRAEVSRVVRQGKKEFEWKVQALLQYRSNPSRFPVTQPASQPATSPTSAPTTRPFEEVQEQIVSDLMKPEVDRKVDEIGTILVERMIADRQAAQQKSANAPADFGSRQYLDRVAADIEKRFGVKLGVSEINDPKSQQALGELKGIGQSFAADVSFPQHVMRWAEPFVSEAQRKDASADVLSLDEPSRKFRDLDGNVYVFQIRSATAAHAPADLNAVKDKVDADVRTKLAFDAAVTAAKKLKESMQPSAALQLAAAAKAAGKDVFTTPGFFDRRGNANAEPMMLLPAVDLSIPARQKLIDGSFELLSEATPDKPHPTAVVELPGATRVVVAELVEVERSWKDDQQDLIQQQVARSLAMQRAERLLAEYFSFNAVKSRLDFNDPNEQPAQTAAAN